MVKKNAKYLWTAMLVLLNMCAVYINIFPYINIGAEYETKFSTNSPDNRYTIDIAYGDISWNFLGSDSIYVRYRLFDNDKNECISELKRLMDKRFVEQGKIDFKLYWYIDHVVLYGGNNSSIKIFYEDVR